MCQDVFSVEEVLSPTFNEYYGEGGGVQCSTEEDSHIEDCPLWTLGVMHILIED